MRTLHQVILLLESSGPIKISDFGSGAKLAVLSLITTVLIVAVIAQTASLDSAEVVWLVFVSVLVAGITSVIVSTRLGPIGSGHILVVGGTGIFIVVAAEALQAGGPALLATLVMVSGLFQWILSRRLHLLRQVMTPLVFGTLLMLVGVSVMPILFGLVIEAPSGESTLGVRLCALTTLAVIIVLAVTARKRFNQWIATIGIGAGAIVGLMFGLYDTESVKTAVWVGIPALQWPGIDLSFRAVFWSVLPGFSLAVIVASLRTVGNSVMVMRESGQSTKAVDFRLVQSALASEGAGNFLAGLAGGVPNMTMLANALYVRNAPNASHKIGVAAGILIILLALLPKVLALIMAIPMAVFGAFLLIAMTLLFLIGVRIVVQDGLDRQGAVIVGLSLLVGIGVEARLIMPDLMADVIGGALENAMTAGGLCAILLTWGIGVTYARPRKFRMRLKVAGLESLQSFLRDLASNYRWTAQATKRLEMVGEEVLLTLLNSGNAGEEDEERHLRLLARRVQGGLLLEFVSARDTDQNLEDQIGMLNSHVKLDAIEDEASLRILRHLSSSVRHQQFHGTDIFTVRVKASG